MSYFYERLADATYLPVIRGYIFRMKVASIAFSRYGVRVYLFGKRIVNWRKV